MNLQRNSLNALSERSQQKATSRPSTEAGGKCYNLCNGVRRKINSAVSIGALVGIAATASTEQACMYDFDQFIACGDTNKDPRCQEPTGSSSSGEGGAPLTTSVSSAESAGGMSTSSVSSGIGGMGGMNAVGGAGGTGGNGGAGGMETSSSVVSSSSSVVSSSSSVVSSSSSSTGSGGGGPLGQLSDSSGDNECIHWLTSTLGTTQNFASDNNVCDPKPLGDIPLSQNESLYVWSKDPASNDHVKFILQGGLTPTQISTKCSTYSTPPNKLQMEGELFSGGYSNISSMGVLPDVELSNSSCPNGAAFVVQF